MSFLKTVPEELLAAAAQLRGIGTSLTAQNAAAAAPTTTLAPAAADEVSALQAGIFGTYGTLYQQLATEAQAMQEQFVHTLGLSSGTYSATEAANATASANPIDSFIDALATQLGGPVHSGTGTPLGLSSNMANFLSYEDGNWASAMSCLIGMAGGGLLPTASADAGADAAAGVEAATLSDTTPVAGAGMMPVAGMGGATMVGNKLSVPQSWVSTAPAVTNPATAIRTVGWTAGGPGGAPGAIIPGMPGMGAGRNSAGFGAPRYGVKPIVMPKPTAV